LKVFYYTKEISRWAKCQKDTFSFVPTMGALHAGHLALVEKAKALGKPVLVSVFVNPAQFNNAEDLQKYPRTLAQDLQLLNKADVDAVFLPVTSDLYPPDLADVTIDLGVLDNIFEGQHRPGHFAGVVKVLHRLFMLLKPGHVFFGQKDLQQCLVVEKLIAQHFPDIKQHNIPTKRDAQTGLALSSRNARLSEKGLEKASYINKALHMIAEKAEYEEAKLLLNNHGVGIEYLEVVALPDMAPATPVSSRNAVVFAGYVEGVRLIDNHII
jgi:pantoate--beta-alanine ligase